MSEDHTSLDMEYDRKLLQDVFDTPDLRYIAMYMFNIRKNLFQDLLDDPLIEEFNIITNLSHPSKADLQRVCSQQFIKDLIDYQVVKNVRNYDLYQLKGPEFSIALDDGIKLAHEEITVDEEEVHIFVKEEYLERLIRNEIPEMTRPQIHKALERMRAMMCPISSQDHELIHKYADWYVLDDDFYYIIEDLGNPYQALRLELMIRAMSDKYKEIENELDELLNQFHPDFNKAKIINKFRKVVEIEQKALQKELLKDENYSEMDAKNAKKLPDIDKEKIDFAEKLKERIRKETLPKKFRLTFEAEDDEDEAEVPELYNNWKEALNHLVKLKLEFDEIDEKMNTLRGYYSGKDQAMPYMEFIEKATFNEDNIAEKVRDLLVESRNSLKKISDGCNTYSKKELRLLNLDLERMIIEEGWDEEEEEE